jgi:hypothetical protein
MFSALQSELIFFDPLNSKEKNNSEEFLLPDLDSNQDYQSQNLKYYHYTIGQFWSANVAELFFLPKSVEQNC